jgi:glycosyltransferase involved in cell wall biosynthesis
VGRVFRLDGDELPGSVKPRVAIVGPVFPFRAGIAYCTTRLARELGADVISFKRLYPRRFYPGGDDVDPTLPRAEGEFILDILNPLTWLRAARRLRAYDSVIFVWWIWVWALPYRLIMALLPRRARVVLQCHNIGEKEPAAWKRALTNLVLRRGDVLVVHAESEAKEARRRVCRERRPRRASAAEGGGATRHAAGGGGATRHAAEGGGATYGGRQRVVSTFLPVHELGGAVPSRAEARGALGVEGNVALFFGHVRPFKGLDIALRAWRELATPATLLVAGEVWWEGEGEYRELARGLDNVRFDFRFIPDSEIAGYFAAADVVLAPYRVEAQSGVALTAFHFARPVIAAAVGGLPEIIDGTNGILVPPEDPSALARAVDEFFTARDRESMERAAAASARRYSWAEYGALLARLVTHE